MNCSLQEGDNQKVTHQTFEIILKESEISKAEEKVDSLRRIFERPIPKHLIEDYLEKEIQTLKLKYITWGCACPNWIEVDTLLFYENRGESLINHAFYIEPSDSINVLSFEKFYSDTNNTIPYAGVYAEIKGRFYKGERLPHGFKHWEQAGVIRTAKVFKYTEWKIKKDYTQYPTKGFKQK